MPCLLSLYLINTSKLSEDYNFKENYCYEEACIPSINISKVYTAPVHYRFNLIEAGAKSLSRTQIIVPSC